MRHHLMSVVMGCGTSSPSETVIGGLVRGHRARRSGALDAIGMDPNALGRDLVAALNALGRHLPWDQLPHGLN